MHHLYILYSESKDRFYIGSTSSTPEERLKKHLTNHSGFTGRVKDWVIAYVEEFANLNEAKSREKQIKNWKSTSAINRLIMNKGV